MGRKFSDSRSYSYLPSISYSLANNNSFVPKYKSPPFCTTFIASPVAISSSLVVAARNALEFLIVAALSTLIAISNSSY